MSCAHNFYQRGYREKAYNAYYIPAANGLVDLESIKGIQISHFFYSKEFEDCQFEEKGKYDYAYGVLKQDCSAD